MVVNVYNYVKQSKVGKQNRQPSTDCRLDTAGFARKVAEILCSTYLWILIKDSIWHEELRFDHGPLAKVENCNSDQEWGCYSRYTKSFLTPGSFRMV